MSVVAYPEDIQGAVAAFKRLNPGHQCERLGLLYVTKEACSRKAQRKGNESDMMFEIRTSACDDCPHHAEDAP